MTSWLVFNSAHKWLVLKRPVTPLLGDGDNNNRKEWIENRLEELAEIFAVAVGGFSVLD